MKGKHFAKASWSRTRIVSVILSIALLFGCITFTSAWLIAEDKEDAPVVNKFTGSKLEIELTPKVDQGPYKLIPGVTYTLTNDAPHVTVTQGSVDCYLFAVIYESWGENNAHINTKDQYFNITGINTTNWKELTGAKSIITNEVPNSVYRVMYYQKNDEQKYVTASEQGQSILILDKFKIPETLTKQQAAPGAFTDDITPKLTIKVYSIQTLGMNNISDAWDWVADAINNNNTKEVVLN